MGTGALIFVDPLMVPHPYPLLHGIHVIYYSNSNKTDLWSKLDYYRTHHEIARKIAIQGYLYAMKYHRAVNFIDYLLRSAHLKKETLANIYSKGDGSNIPRYSYTAQYLTYEAHRQEKVIKQTQWPGVYSSSRMMRNHTHILEEVY